MDSLIFDRVIMCFLHFFQKSTLTLHKSQDLFILFFGLTLFHQVDFILQYKYVLQLHDLNGCQML